VTSAPKQTHGGHVALRMGVATPLPPATCNCASNILLSLRLEEEGGVVVMCCGSADNARFEAWSLPAEQGIYPALRRRETFNGVATCLQRIAPTCYHGYCFVLSTVNLRLTSERNITLSLYGRYRYRRGREGNTAKR
jgi:hypothetical protein